MKTDLYSTQNDRTQGGLNRHAAVCEESLTRTLDETADYLDGEAHELTGSLSPSFARRKASVRNFGLAGVQGVFTAQMDAFLFLARRIMGLTVSLDEVIRS